MVRRDAFLEAGGFSDALHFGGEEELLALDLAAAGWGLAYLPELVVHHHPSQRRPDPAVRRRRQARNRLLTAWMRRPLPVFGREVKAALTTRDGRTALAEAVRAWPKVALARRRVPPEVERARAILEAH
jgi:GT2 family glycosyltransferase